MKSEIEIELETLSFWDRLTEDEKQELRMLIHHNFGVTV